MGRAKGRGQAVVAAGTRTRADMVSEAAKIDAAGMFVATFQVRSELNSEEVQEQLLSFASALSKTAPKVEITVTEAEYSTGGLFSRARKQVLVSVNGPKLQAESVARNIELTLRRLGALEDMRDTSAYGRAHMEELAAAEADWR